MLALLPTNSPAPMMPPIEISATCRQRSVRLTVRTAGGETALVVGGLRKRSLVRWSALRAKAGGPPMKSPFLVCAALTTLLLGCQDPGGAPPSPATATAPNAEWDAFRDAFIEGYFELNPSFAVRQGRHEFDGQ